MLTKLTVLNYFKISRKPFLDARLSLYQSAPLSLPLASLMASGPRSILRQHFSWHLASYLLGVRKISNRKQEIFKISFSA